MLARARGQRARGRRAGRNLKSACDVGPHLEEIADHKADGVSGAASPVQIQYFHSGCGGRWVACQLVVSDEFIRGRANSVDADNLDRVRARLLET